MAKGVYRRLLLDVNWSEAAQRTAAQPRRRATRAGVGPREPRGGGAPREQRMLTWRLKLECCRDFRPGILQRHGAVEHQGAGGGVAVDGEVAEPFELVARAGRRRRHARLEPAAAEDFERGRIQVAAVVVGVAWHFA